MVPSKGKDFTAAHPGFERQEEGLGYDMSGPIMAETFCNGRYLVVGYPSPTGGRTRRFLYILEGIGPDQTPSDGL